MKLARYSGYYLNKSTFYSLNKETVWLPNERNK